MHNISQTPSSEQQQQQQQVRVLLGGFVSRVEFVIVIADLHAWLGIWELLGWQVSLSCWVEWPVGNVKQKQVHQKQPAASAPRWVLQGQVMALLRQWHRVMRVGACCIAHVLFCHCLLPRCFPSGSWL